MDDLFPEYSYLQFGNPALHHVRLSFGHGPQPYGVDQRVLPDIYQDSIKNTEYWRFPKYFAKAVYDNQLDTVLEIGTGSSSLPGALVEPSNDRTQDSSNTISGRLSHDIAALGGTRISIFGLRGTPFDRRLGAALVNVTKRNAITTLEWQRRYGQQEFEDDYHQLFRLNFIGGYERSAKFVFEYEDDRKIYSLLSIGQDYFLPDYGSFRTTISYYKDRQRPDRTKFLLTLGLEVAL